MKLTEAFPNPSVCFPMIPISQGAEGPGSVSSPLSLDLMCLLSHNFFSARRDFWHSSKIPEMNRINARNTCSDMHPQYPELHPSAPPLAQSTEVNVCKSGKDLADAALTFLSVAGMVFVEETADTLGIGFVNHLPRQC